MRFDDLINHQKKRPFVPIRLNFSDGASYEVRHPEMMVVGRSEVAVATLTAVGERDHLVYLDPVHITRVEPINGNGQQEQES